MAGLRTGRTRNLIYVFRYLVNNFNDTGRSRWLFPTLCERGAHAYVDRRWRA